jgi:hypothetical protein
MGACRYASSLMMPTKASRLGIVALGAFVLALVWWRRYLPVEERPIDVLVVVLLGLAVGALGHQAVRWAGRSQALGKQFTWNEFIATCVYASAIIATVLCLLNIVLDSSSPKTFIATVEQIRCGRAFRCDAYLSADSSLPRWLTAVPLSPRSNFSPEANRADSVVVVVRSGFFNRPWIASYEFHRRQ